MTDQRKSPPSFSTIWAHAPSTTLRWLGRKLILDERELRLPPDFWNIPADRIVPSPAELNEGKIQRQQLATDYFRRALTNEVAVLASRLFTFVLLSLTALAMIVMGGAISVLGIATAVGLGVWASWILKRRLSTATAAGAKILGKQIDIGKLLDEAKAEATLLTARSDAPQRLKNGGPIPEDLRDTKGRFYKLPDGSPVSGRMLIEDLLGTSSPSAATPLLLVALPIMVLAGLILVAGLGSFGFVSSQLEASSSAKLILMAAINAVVVAVSGGLVTLAVRVYNASMTWVSLRDSVCFVLLFLLGWVASLALMVEPKVMIMAATGVGVAMLLFLTVNLAMVVFSKVDPKTAYRRIGYALLGLILAVAGPLGTVGAAVVMGRLPVLWHQRMRENRLATLLRRNTQFLGEELGANVDENLTARIGQAEDAAKDTSPLIALGVATGTFSMLGDAFAPDKGLPVVMSGEDSTTHTMVTGATGSGKTGSALRPILKSWLDGKSGGALILDGKGPLALEMKGLPDYLLIEAPNGGENPVMLGIIEGLDPSSLARTLRSCFAGAKTGGEDGGFFEAAAERHVFFSGILLQALNAIKAEPDNAWTMTNLDIMCKLVGTIPQKGVPGAPQEPDVIAETVAFLTQWDPSASEPGSLLAQAIQYAQNEARSMGDRTLGNVNATVSQWIGPIMSNGRLLAWANCEHGVNPLECLEGRVVGLALPETEFGPAGRAISALIKARVLKGVKARGADKEWRTNRPEQKDLLLMVDECQELVDTNDYEVVAVARSLGCRFVMATQSLKAIEVRLGRDRAHAFLNNFRNLIVFYADPETYEWVSKRVGNIWRYVRRLHTKSPDYVGTAQLMAGRSVYDPNNPDYERLRYWREQGLVKFDELASRERNASSVYGDDYREGKENVQEVPSLRIGMMMREWVKDALFGPPEYQLLNEKGMALVIVNRANRPRRDIVKTTYIHQMEYAEN